MSKKKKIEPLTKEDLIKIVKEVIVRECSFLRNYEQITSYSFDTDCGDGTIYKFVRDTIGEKTYRLEQKIDEKKEEIDQRLKKELDDIKLRLCKLERFPR